MSVPLTITIAGKKEQAQAFKDRIREEATKRSMSDSEFVVEAVAEYIRNHNED